MGYIDESLAVVSYLAKTASQNGRLGKKAAQKLVHLLERMAKVPLKYNFELYTYGPFSRELAGDLDILDAIQAIQVCYDSEKNGYEIQAGPRADEIIDRFSPFISEHKERIDSIISKFGDRLAKDLELTSTLLFILDGNLVDDINNDEEVIDKFSEIKPHYRHNEIQIRLNELREVLNN